MISACYERPFKLLPVIDGLAQEVTVLVYGRDRIK